MKDFEKMARTARMSALARPEIGAVRYTDVTVALPDFNRECTAWVVGQHGEGEPYRLPFAVVMDSAGDWRSVSRGSKLTVRVVGWNYRSTMP